MIAAAPFIGERQAGEQIAAQLVALNSQRSGLNASLQAHAMAAQMAHQRIDTIQPLIRQEQLNGDANYKSLQDQAAKDWTTQALVKAQYTDKYPGLPGLADQVARTRALLSQEEQRALSSGPGSSATYSSALRDAQMADGSVSADQAQLTAINQQIAQAESNLAALPNLGVKVAALRRERDASETAYEILAEQRTITLAEQARSCGPRFDHGRRPRDGRGAGAGTSLALDANRGRPGLCRHRTLFAVRARSRRHALASSRID